MTVTHFHTDARRLVPNRALGYGGRDGAWTLDTPINERAGAGGLYTSIPDLQKWDENFYSGKVGGKDVIDQLLTRGVLNNGRPLAYAWGLQIGNYGDEEIVEHSGSLGGYRARGSSDAEAEKILADARAVAEAGCFALVLEGVMEEIAVEATRSVGCPTIGIGASAQCDGQILVTDDMMGLFERTPRFVKRYDNLAEQIGKAAETYASEVRSRTFPSADQTYRPKGS